MARKLLPLLLLAALGACRTPGLPVAPMAANPGWGRPTLPARVALTVRAVPASSAPSLPPVRLGKPGWGR